MVKLIRTLVFAIVGAGALVVAPVVSAQNYPNKPITIIVPFPPGGTTDVLARAIGQKLSEAWGQPVLVENRPGAGATIGAAYVAKAAPDGYTLLMGAVHHTIAASLYAQGTAQHLMGEQFGTMTGVPLLHVPYKGSGPLTTDLVAGQVQMSFDTMTPVLPHIKAGKLRALAVTTAKRSASLPDLPTLAESGLAGFDQGTWFGLLATAGTPQDIVTKLNAEVVKILKTPEIQKRWFDIGAEAVANSPAEMAATIKSDTERYAAVVKKAGIKVE